MGLVIDLGLQRFYEPNDERWTKALDAIVEMGITSVVRDVIGPGRSEAADWLSARVYEAKRIGRDVKGRWLSATEAKPLLDELATEIEQAGGYASYSWDELEELGVELQTLELVLDEREPPLSETDELRNLARRLGHETITLPGYSEVRVGDLIKSNRQWDDWDDMSNTVCAIHSVAIRHRMIVHNA